MITATRTGWIGVDIGTSTVKVAQTVRSNRRWRLAAATIVPRRDVWPEDFSPESELRSSADEIKASQSLQGSYFGNRVAATLPMALCDIHSLDRALDGDPHAPQIIRQAIEVATQRSAEGLEFGYWPVGPNARAKGTDWTNVLTVPRNWSDQLYDDIVQSGWSCQAIDGLPFALARAVDMLEGGRPDGPVAVLDWGFRCATLCVIVDGVPAYVRCLKACGFERTLSTMIENLGIAHEEAQQLLEAHGLPDPTAETNTEASELIRETAAEPLAHLVEEIRRSISHFENQRRVDAPRQLILLGGGATIRRLPDFLTERLEMQTRRWSLDGDSGATTDTASSSCLFGPAAALSALAWRAS